MSDDTLYLGDSPTVLGGHYAAERVFALDLAARASVAAQWPP